MIKKITCIECPVGCQLEVETDQSGHVIKVTGNKCEKGPVYAKQETENPMRILTSIVLTEGLDLKMVPVKTNKPIPKAKLMEAMAAVKKLKLTKQVKVDETIASDFLGLGVDLIATRPASFNSH
ncbi:MAG: DUF1667 domain-containing protein [Candidatus Margulisbacteria bacterium]|nr:DUF1667 domain-containing protein [Candidatus Margulisiibacteriota bacterium]